MFEKQYKETFSQVVASDSLMQEVLNLKNKKRNKIRVMTLVAAVLLVCALATSAVAYAGFKVYENPQQMLEAFFGSGNEQNHEGKVYIDDVGQITNDPSFQREELNPEVAGEYVAPYIFEVGQSITHNGYTLTVDAASYDPYTQCGIVYMHLENPNGLPAYRVGVDGSYYNQEPSPISSNMIPYYFVDEAQTTDTCLYLAAYIRKGDYMKDAVLQFRLEEDTQQIIIPLEATKTMEHITLGNGGIQLSPIGLVIHGDILGLLRGTETHVNTAIIRYTDGSEYIVTDNSGETLIINHAAATKEPGDGYETNRRCVTYLLNRIVPVHEVSNVIVDGVSYSVDPEPIDKQVISNVPENKPKENNGTLQDIWSVANTTGPTMELTEGAVSGSLLYTITEVQYFDRVPVLEMSWNRDDFNNPLAPWGYHTVFETGSGYWVDWRFPIDKVSVEFGMKHDATVQVLENGQWVEYAWDNIKNEDGTLKYGVQLVLVDVIIEGQDAVAPDMVDYDISPEYGYHRGDHEFFIDRLQLVDTSVTSADGLHPVKDTDFWSFYWEGEPNPVYDSVQIHPNIREFYTFGFLIGANQQDGNPLDLSNLYLCAEEDTMQTNLISLKSIK